MHRLYSDNKPISKPHPHYWTCVIEAYEKGLIIRWPIFSPWKSRHTITRGVEIRKES